MNKESAVKNISDMLISGKVAPWKAEQVSCTSPTTMQISAQGIFNDVRL
ncbi:MAG: hypothetical protein PVG51_11470 [Desulfosarcina sp.]|jgi:hypothetical protein